VFNRSRCNNRVGRGRGRIQDAIEASLEPLLHEEAVNWLRKVKQAYLALDQRQEWQAYLGTLREKHRSRRKLMPMLAGL
jgi:hypothetical protein